MSAKRRMLGNYYQDGRPGQQERILYISGRHLKGCGAWRQALVNDLLSR